MKKTFQQKMRLVWLKVLAALKATSGLKGASCKHPLAKEGP